MQSEHRTTPCNRGRFTTQPWSDSRDTFVLTVPTSAIEIEPAFAGSGSTISMLIRPACRRNAIGAIRGVLDELESMEPRS